MRKISVPLLLAFLFLSFLFFCRNKPNNNPKSNQVCRIVVISPYGCINEIKFTEIGSGIFKSGISNGSITDTNTEIDTVLSIDTFRITNLEHLELINTYVQSFLLADNLIGYPKQDAFRFRIFVNDLNKVDVYGGIIEVNRILESLIEYLPLSKDKCNFLKQFYWRGVALRTSQHKADPSLTASLMAMSKEDPEETEIKSLIFLFWIQ